MDRVVANHEKYAKLIVEFGSRNNIKDQELSTLAKNSVGIEFEEKDIRIAQKLAQSILNLYSLKEDLTRYTEDATKTIAPNISEIAGPMLAARLISKAGSLEKLAKSASSTIQLLGAEKSLFRFLHGKGKSPRFGILATHPLVQNAPEKLKGKVARSIASKLSIAAKIDFYSKEDKSKEMKKELQEKIKEILSSSQA
jgi:nucleolar protein 56